MGNMIVLTALAVAVGLAIRSIRKSGGCHCDGNCDRCAHSLQRSDCRSLH